MKNVILASCVLASLSVIACSAAPPSGDSTSTTQSGITLCAKAACGPELGEPEYLCPDGKTWAGPTGECVRDQNDPSCHWQIGVCPPDDCTKQECGPEPLVPDEKCPDGSVAGEVCERENGVCGWHYRGCPDAGVGAGDAGFACACPNGEKTCSISCPNGATGQCVDGVPSCP
jgi:hypothetical protein